MSSGSPDEADWSSGGRDDAVVRALAAGPSTAGAEGVPAVQVVRGQPDEVELAALVAGIVAHRAANGHVEDEPVPSAWCDRARQLGASPAPGPATWRWSARR